MKKRWVWLNPSLTDTLSRLSHIDSDAKVAPEKSEKVNNHCVMYQHKAVWLSYPAPWQRFFFFGRSLFFFSQTSKKQWSRAPPFFTHCLYIFFAHLKSSDQGRSRSGHQVTSSDLTSESLNARHPRNYTTTARSPRNFQQLIWVTVSIKCRSRNFEIGDLSTCQFCNISITLKANGRKLKGGSFGRKPF